MKSMNKRQRLAYWRQPEVVEATNTIKALLLIGVILLAVTVIVTYLWSASNDIIWGGF